VARGVFEIPSVLQSRGSFLKKIAKYCFFKIMKIRENNRIRTIAFVGLFSIMDQNRSKLKRVRSVWVKEYRRCFGHLPLISEL
jgi:hypothetical protein